MKLLYRALLTIFITGFTLFSVAAQTKSSDKLIYSVKLNFQTYGLPLKNLAAGFKNTGLAIRADYVLNQKHNLYQSFTIGYQTHTQHETGIYLNTQFCYRTAIFKTLEPGLAFGLGRLISVANPKNSYYSFSDNTWQKSRRQTKGHWQIPLGLSLGYRLHTNHKITTPFISYETVPVIKYNSNFVALPYSLLSFGTRIN